jgi:hypothetical protein
MQLRLGEGKAGTKSGPAGTSEKITAGSSALVLWLVRDHCRQVCRIVLRIDRPASVFCMAFTFGSQPDVAPAAMFWNMPSDPYVILMRSLCGHYAAAAFTEPCAEPALLLSI